MTSSFTFLRVRGIAIGANWSWLIVFALIAWSLTSALFPRTYPGLDQSTYVWMGFIAAVLFFVSILLHELGHAFRALKEGMEIDGITLWLFGGVARFKSQFPSPGAEFRIAIAGPVVSALIAGGFFLASWAGNALALPTPLVGVADYLFRINAIVLGFNLVPALPLDGGRVLRSYLWHRQQSFSAATISAAKAGRAFAWMLIGIGVLGFITGAGIGGIWFAFLGWFLLQAAGAEANYALVRQALSGLCVRDLMTPDPVTIDARTSLSEFVDVVQRQRGHSTYPVVSHGRLEGLVSLRHAASVDPEQRTTTSIGDVMLGVDDVPTVHPDAELFEALTRLQEDGPKRAVVLEDGDHVVGILSAADIARALEIERTLGPRPQEAEAQRKAGWPVWVVVGVIMFIAAGYLYHPPVAVVEPGEALDITGDISISGTEVDEIDGRYLLTSVRLGQPNGLGLLLAVVRSRQVTPVSQLVPEGTEPEQYFEQQQDIFEESQRVAAAAAARAVGMEVSITGEGVRVVAVAPGSPAAEALQEGDVIVAIDGDPTRIAGELQEAIRSRPAGTSFTLTVERDGDTEEIAVTSRRLDTPDDIVGIGVLIETVDLVVDLPFEVEFTDRPIGGPSAGLPYALAIADMLDDENWADGRVIAATGTMSLDGSVGPVGGVDVKAEAAEDAGATLFLVPPGLVDQARGAGISVRGVPALEDAIEVVRGGA